MVSRDSTPCPRDSCNGGWPTWASMILQSPSNCTDLPFWGKKWQNQEARRWRLIDNILLPQWRQETTPSCPRDLYACGEWLMGVWEAHNRHQIAQISHFSTICKTTFGRRQKETDLQHLLQPDTSQNASAIPQDTYEGERTLGGSRRCQNGCDLVGQKWWPKSISIKLKWRSRHLCGGPQRQPQHPWSCRLHWPFPLIHAKRIEP
jgi:hypothetical protein